ncbi:hypothetical protein Q7C36_007057 [Tachysurus vachellii]|uniref:EF-hand domain-containing protein n=1 Tax=Tachysurus vachellii TaxID=175792 RepID=A0AA88NAP6_TACVA|nr:hypothetical protein Q7C36_007057 [Tachysurus vachellii]
MSYLEKALLEVSEDNARKERKFLILLHLCFHWSNSLSEPKVIMSQLQAAMLSLIAIFKKYAGKDKDANTLSKGELKDLLNAEMGGMFGDCNDQAKLDKIFKDLDSNSDGTVDFKEFVTMLSAHKLKAIMSQLQQGMGMLIAAFHKYSGKEGDKLTLSKGELKDLLNAEMGDILGKTQDKAALDKIFKDLDANQDGTVDFQEYITLVACITMMCNEYFTKK